MTRRVFVALDTASREQAAYWAKALAPHAAGLKLGLEFFLAHGAEGVRHIAALSPLPLFLDLKLHDIPHTVAAAIRALMPLGVRYITVHTQGGPAMLRAALESAEEAASTHCLPPPMILGVTVLTSLDASELAAIGQDASPAHYALCLARMAQQAGVEGFVASAQEVARLRAELGNQITLFTPGIRPESTAAGDQKRIATPENAINAGARFLVIGRPITHATDPVAALQAINARLEAV